MKIYWKNLICLIFVPIFVQADSLTFFKGHQFPGGVAVLELPNSIISATYKGRQVFIDSTNNKPKALVGIPLSTKPGIEKIKLSSGKELSFKVQPFDYPEQRIKLKNKRQVNPNPLDLERIKKEATRQRKATRNFNKNRIPNLKMSLPVSGIISGPFGRKRFFNDQPRRPHSGIDIAAPSGTKILAAADGEIALVGDFFFNGKLVIIDHGQGVTSMYCHLKDISVRQGDMITEKQVLGTVGSTGRSTGPHLHFGVAINGAWVNPSLFVHGISSLK